MTSSRKANGLSKRRPPSVGNVQWTDHGEKRRLERIPDVDWSREIMLARDPYPHELTALTVSGRHRTSATYYLIGPSGVCFVMGPGHKVATVFMLGMLP